VQRGKVNTGLAILMGAAISGCAWGEERLDNVPLAVLPYNTTEHLPPDPETNGPTFAGRQEIRQLLRNDQFGLALEKLNIEVAAVSELEFGAGAHPRLLVLRGIALYALQDPQTALTDYNEAIALDGRCWPAYFHRWQCHLKLGNRAAAQADREAGRRLAPEEFDRDYGPDAFREHGGMI